MRRLIAALVLLGVGFLAGQEWRASQQPELRGAGWSSFCHAWQDGAPVWRASALPCARWRGYLVVRLPRGLP